MGLAGEAGAVVAGAGAVVGGAGAVVAGAGAVVAGAVVAGGDAGVVTEACAAAEW
jgi:hypothetical protein